jgi:NADH-quinone oxidoreductase subunit I
MVMKMIGKGLLKGLAITFKHTFEKDITIQYPEERPFLQERFRGCLAFDFSRCIACGMCSKACPNRVLSLETTQREGSKKKFLLSYTIDLQYCMFCNLCVEACPVNCLYFTHDFELTRSRREDIKMVYSRPPELALPEETEAEGQEDMKAAPDELTEAEARRLKQLEAMKTALGRNPVKLLAKLLDAEDERLILAELLAADEKKRDKMAEMMISDMDKARKVAQAFVAREKKNCRQEGDGE